MMNREEAFDKMRVKSYGENNNINKNVDGIKIIYENMSFEEKRKVQGKGKLSPILNENLFKKMKGGHQR